MIPVLLFTAILGLQNCGTNSPAGQKTSESRSPQTTALQLVLELRREEIGMLDSEDWWIDTDNRNWSVKRAFSPGYLDSTHLFFVTYKRNKVTLKTWFVDTKKGTVEDSKSNATHSKTK